jgi:hypothetical protein
MQDDGIMSQDELLAKLMSGDMHAPRIGLKSAQSNKKSKAQKKKAKKAKEQEKKEAKEEEQKENKARKDHLSEAKKEMKSNLRKALQGKLVQAPVVMKSGKAARNPGGRMQWALKHGY